MDLYEVGKLHGLGADAVAFGKMVVSVRDHTDVQDRVGSVGRRVRISAANTNDDLVAPRR
ncbi:hypothetical protein TRAPUB_732 [Trametes pubescens]|uniref:Uncharacterized protein n=1 Tax=Trametes pubescens TaxID=154538 RepID=A0A1M2VLF8_TRAPU|nr:hypothetical protein TRAPUB_732 [Trametes pubescens]